MFNVMIIASRKAGVSHERFRERYERHMEMVKDLCGDAAPTSHTRWYPHHTSADDQPNLLAGNTEQTVPSVVVVMAFQDFAAWERFCSALSTDEAKAAIDADEAGFWDRDDMKVMIVDGGKTWGA